MYAVKGRGGNAVMTFDTDHEDSSRDLLRMKTELRLDIERASISALAQPIVALAERTVVGMALQPRWIRSTGEAVAPSVFVPLIEQLGLDRSLGRIMLDHAAATARRLDLVCTVNASFRHLVSGHLFIDLLDATTRHETPLGQLVVAIGESHASAGSDRAIDEITRLQGIGVRVALDDWGVGASSIACLERLPMDWLRLAPELADQVMSSDRSMRVIRRIAGLAGELDIDVVAVGIDDERTATMVESIGIRLGQGAHLGGLRPIGEPVPGEPKPGVTNPG